jgi:DNA-binding GntR family transcriptional regulator
LAIGSALILPLGPAVKTTYKAAVYDVLYDLIANLTIQPGERLIEATLASRFGVSKTPIREALLQLESEGVVSMTPHAGATVTLLALEDYEQLLFILDALEQPALRLVLDRIRPDELASCGKIVSRIGTAFAARDAATYIRLVLQLHSDLFAAARYPLLTDMIDTVQRHARRYTSAFVRQYPENWAREWEVVRQRYEFIRAGDAEGAAAAVQRGHAALLEFARQRVAEKDPLVMRYMSAPLT